MTNNKVTDKQPDIEPVSSASVDTAVFGAGCFWCVEAVFQNLRGVYKVESGYAGGHKDNPSYKEVCAGNTGHVEVAKITFDPSVISYEQLLEVFWRTHDPTTLNRQGGDVGEQYRSVIMYVNDEQKETAQESMQNADRAGIWPDRIVTAIEPLKNYFPAEDYHQNYYANNSNQPYCSAVITPKLNKFFKQFSHLLKNNSN